MELNQVVELRYPREFEGTKYEKVELDLSRLTGAALRKAEQRVVMGQNVPLGPASCDYCAHCAAEAAGVPYELINELMGPDYQEVVLIVQNFLLGAELPETGE